MIGTRLFIEYNLNMSETDFAYIPRVFDQTLEKTLRRKGAVVVTGPKWCGKSTTTKRFAASIRDLMPVSTRENLIRMARLMPGTFLKGDKPLLIDEWQHVSFLWDEIKSQVDSAHSFGLFILAGSVTDQSIMDKVEAEESAPRHTGNGRFVKKKMRTMSLYESGEGSGNVSLEKLRTDVFTPATCDMGVEDYAFCLCRGGWPLSIGMEKEDAIANAYDYYETIAEEDLFSLRNPKLDKNPQRARILLRSYARNVSTPASDKTLMEDVAANDGTFDEATFKRYHTALNELYAIEELEAWNPRLRSRASIRNKATRHFVDPSIATAALGVGPEGLFEDMMTFGLLFESLAVRDIRIYAEANDAHVYKYRDNRGREADIVIQWKNGDFALCEVKLGGSKDIDEAARKLIALSSDIDHEKTGKAAAQGGDRVDQGILC